MLEKFFTKRAIKKSYVFLIVAAIVFIFFFFLTPGVIISFFTPVGWILLILGIATLAGYKMSQIYEKKILEPLEENRTKVELKEQNGKNELPKEELDKPKVETIYIIMLGEAKVGKSGLISQYEGKGFSSGYEETEVTEIFIKEKNVKFIEVGGNYSVLAKSNIKPKENLKLGIVLVYDVNSTDSFNKITRGWVEILKKCDFSSCPPITLIGNRPKEKLSAAITEEQGKKLAETLREELKASVNSYLTDTQATKDEVSFIFDNLIDRISNPRVLAREEKKEASAFLVGSELESLVKEQKGDVFAFFNELNKSPEEQKARKMLYHIAVKSFSVEEQVKKILALGNYIYIKCPIFLPVLNQIVGSADKDGEFSAEYKKACLSLRASLSDDERLKEAIATLGKAFEYAEEKETEEPDEVMRKFEGPSFTTPPKTL